MRIRLTISILIILVAARYSATAAQEQRWLSYDPATVELEGKLITQMRYGPPNFGERPKTDQKLTVPILVLENTVNIRGTPGDGFNAQSVEGVKRIQLVFSNGPTAYRHLIGKHIVVKGKLFHGFSGHHFTDVLLEVLSIEGKVKSTNRPDRNQTKPGPCADAMTQFEINQCAGEQFRKTDQQLNVVYKRIQRDLNSTDRGNLIETQRAWLKYRAANCWAERQFKGGSLGPAREAFCLLDLTEARTKELIRIYETVDDR